MRSHRLTTMSMLLLAAGGLVVGLALPAAGHEAKHLISGSSIKKHSIAGNRLKANTVTGAQVKESTLGTVPAAKAAATVPALVWHALTLNSGWTDVGAPARPVGYAIDIQGLVHLRGEVQCLVPTACNIDVFTLPTVVRPDVELDFPVVTASENIGDLDISPTGDTTVIDTAGATAGEAKRLSTFDGVVYSRT
jgi:hypothetical protein